MNKMSKCKMVSLVALISACQAFPSVAMADNSSAKAETKPVESVKPPEPRTPATEVARSEPKAESKASAEPVSMITPMMERQQTIRATGYAGTTKQLMCHQFLALFRQDLVVTGWNFIGSIVKKLSFNYFLAVLLSFR